MLEWFARKWIRKQLHSYQRDALMDLLVSEYRYVYYEDNSPTMLAVLKEDVDAAVERNAPGTLQFVNSL